MQFFKLLVLSLSLAYGGDIHQKLIIDGYKDSAKAKMMLMKTQLYIINNEDIRKIVKKEKLRLEIEDIGNYSMVVIKPIDSIETKEHLMFALGSFSPTRFCIRDEYTDVFDTIQATSEDNKVWELVETNINMIGFEWIILLLLSLVGLIASIINRKKLSKLNSMQKDIIKNQKIMENEINSLGTKE